MAARKKINPDQFALFDMPPDPPSPITALPMILPEEPMWHASHDEKLPTKDRGEGIPFDEGIDDMTGMGHPLGFHIGSLTSARDRMRSHSNESNRNIHPVNITEGETALPTRYGKAYDGHDIPGVEDLWNDGAANSHTAATEAVSKGKIVQYENESEDRGSISIRAPRGRIRTWSDSVLADPSSVGYRERKAAYEGAELVYHRPTITDDDKWEDASGFREAGLVAPPSFDHRGRRFGSYFEEDPKRDDVDDLVVPHLVYPHRAEKPKKAEEPHPRLPGI